MCMLDELFAQPKLTGKNLNTLINKKGYTKSTIVKITNIPRYELDKLIHGLINNKDTFIKYILAINKTNIKISDLYDYLNTKSQIKCWYKHYFHQLIPSLIIATSSAILDLFIPTNVFKILAYIMIYAITIYSLSSYFIINNKQFKNKH